MSVLQSTRRFIWIHSRLSSRVKLCEQTAMPADKCLSAGVCCSTLNYGAHQIFTIHRLFRKWWNDNNLSDSQLFWIAYNSRSNNIKNNNVILPSPSAVAWWHPAEEWAQLFMHQTHNVNLTVNYTLNYFSFFFFFFFRDFRENPVEMSSTLGWKPPFIRKNLALLPVVCHRATYWATSVWMGTQRTEIRNPFSNPALVLTRESVVWQKDWE